MELHGMVKLCMRIHIQHIQNNMLFEFTVRLYKNERNESKKLNFLSI